MKEVRLINADTLWKQVDSLIKPSSTEGAIIFQQVLALIEDAHTVDAEPMRHGHWEWNDYGGFGNYHCSVCKYIPYKYIPYAKFPRKPHPDYMYCPKCGAKMDERIEDVEIR